MLNLNQSIRQMNKAQVSRMYTDVEYLTEKIPYRNYRNLEALKLASDWIYEELQSAGMEVSEQVWRTQSHGRNEYRNIIGRWKPNAKKRFIIGAHYDVDGDQPGADDNASAVAGLLETARLISENNPNTDFGIDFVGYCLEECPFFHTVDMGSYVHARSVYERGDEVIGMVCYEMIGFFSDKPNSQSNPFDHIRVPTVGNFITVVGRKDQNDFVSRFYEGMNKDSEVDVLKFALPSNSMYIQLSDQASYYKFGYNAVMINDTAYFRSPHYHQKSDTIHTLDFDKMSKVVDSTYRAIVNF